VNDETVCENDVAEALQGVPCLIRHNLVFQEPVPTSALEASLSDGDVEEGGWDCDGDAVEGETLLDDFVMVDTPK
jgi:hypothetical protein